MLDFRSGDPDASIRSYALGDSLFELEYGEGVYFKSLIDLKTKAGIVPLWAHFRLRDQQLQFGEIEIPDLETAELLGLLWMLRYLHKRAKGTWPHTVYELMDYEVMRTYGSRDNHLGLPIGETRRFGELIGDDPLYREANHNLRMQLEA